MPLLNKNKETSDAMPNIKISQASPALPNILPNKPNNSIKVINLAQLHQQQDTGATKSTNNPPKVLTISAPYAPNQYQASNSTVTKPQTLNSDSSNSVKITKVVSSRISSNMDTSGNDSQNNLVYYSKNANNQYIPISLPVVKQLNHSVSTSSFFVNKKLPLNPNDSNQLATMRVACNNNQAASTSVNKNGSMPKFYTTSKAFTAHYVNSSSANGSVIKFNGGNSQNSHHLDALNTNITRYAQSTAQKPGSIG